MATFNDLLLEARPGLRDCPDFSILSALRRAAQDFCRETEAWATELDPVALRNGVSVYDLILESGVQVERIKEAKGSWTDRPLALMTPAQIFALPARSGGVHAIAMTADGAAIKVYGTPNQDDAGKTISMYVVQSPSRTARNLPDHIANRWHEAIVARAKADLQAIPGMAWTNPGAANLAMSIFNDEVAKARRVHMTGHMTQQRIKLRPLA